MTSIYSLINNTLILWSKENSFPNYNKFIYDYFLEPYLMILFQLWPILYHLQIQHHSPLEFETHKLCMDYD